MSRNKLIARKHYISAVKNDVVVFHKGTDNLATALKWFAEQVELSINYHAAKMAHERVGLTKPQECNAPESVTMYKGRAQKPFAVFHVEQLTGETK